MSHEYCTLSQQKARKEPVLQTSTMLPEKQSMEHAIVSIQVLITKYLHIFNFSKPSG